MKNFVELATDKQGLCVMKVLIECTNTKELRVRIVNKILEKVLMYAQNEFGNFVVSEVLSRYSKDSFEILQDIYNQLEGNYVKLS